MPSATTTPISLMVESADAICEHQIKPYNSGTLVGF